MRSLLLVCAFALCLSCPCYSQTVLDDATMQRGSLQGLSSLTLSLRVAGLDAKTVGGFAGERLRRLGVPVASSDSDSFALLVVTLSPKRGRTALLSVEVVQAAKLSRNGSLVFVSTWARREVLPAADWGSVRPLLDSMLSDLSSDWHKANE